MVDSARLAPPVDGARAAGGRRAVDPLAAARRAAPPARQVLARVLRGRRARRGEDRRSVRAGRDVPAAPGVDLGGWHRPHALAPRRFEAPPARMADRVAGRAPDEARGTRVASDLAGDVAGVTGGAA